MYGLKFPHSARTREIRFVLNGSETSVRVPPGYTLLETLRYVLRMTGTKEGCARGDCGECTVLVDGVPVHACLTLMSQVEGRSVLTVEGIDRQHRLIRAFVEEGAVQCGHCTPGIVVAAYHLLSQVPRPTEEQVREALRGNLCRCTGYVKIIRAVLKAGEA
ncbi:MAG: (2Fe-2S)-binding protein [Aigarchaeota archaeon]|nr:(2Fe-2S)-binding protein [Candidatus Calditenuis fumarioli]